MEAHWLIQCSPKDKRGSGKELQSLWLHTNPAPGYCKLYISHKLRGKLCNVKVLKCGEDDPEFPCCQEDLSSKDS